MYHVSVATLVEHLYVEFADKTLQLFVVSVNISYRWWAIKIANVTPLSVSINRRSRCHLSRVGQSVYSLCD